MNIEQIITYIAGIAVAAIAGWQSVRAQVNKNSLKKVSRKLDTDPIILKGMLAAETMFNGFEKSCGRCKQPEECTKTRHSSNKKDYAMTYIKKKLDKMEIPFVYKDADSKIEEFMFLFRAEGIKQDNRHSQHAIEERVKVGVPIEKILERLLYSTNCNRAYVMEFHNGASNFANLGFLRMSCTYEACSPGIPSEIVGRTDMYAQMFSRGISAVMTRDYLILDTRNPNAEDETKLAYETLRERKVLVTVRVKIVDIHKQVIGYLGIDFCKEPDEEAVNQSIEKLKSAAIELGVLLSAHK